MSKSISNSRPLRIFLIRHGETAWSASGQFTGTTDIPLNDIGQAQSKALAPFLASIEFAHVETSSLQRAKQTCNAAGLNTAAKESKELIEWDYGIYEGQYSASVYKKDPSWNIFRDGCPGGESPGQVAHRADSVIEKWKAKEGNIAVFTHGHFARVLATRWIGLPILHARNFLLGTTAVSLLCYDPHHLDIPVIGMWNTSPDHFSNPLPDQENASIMKRNALARWENEGGDID